MQPGERRSRIVRTVVMTAALLAVMASVMVPGLTREAAVQARAEVRAAVQAHMVDFPPPMPATSIGDPYYQWSTVACPGGDYRAPDAKPPDSALASAPAGES